MTDLLERLRAALAGRYVLEGEAGAGGMAIVYRAHDVRHNRTVAVKVVRPELAGSLGIDRFLREIELAARLQHPHILPVFDSGAVDEGTAAAVPWFVMPFVEGESLRQRLQRESRLPVDEAVTLAGEVADALAYAHAHGVVHRDIKPENILLTGAPVPGAKAMGGTHAVVADFGVAKAIERSAVVSSTAATSARITRVGWRSALRTVPSRPPGPTSWTRAPISTVWPACCMRCSPARRRSPAPRRSPSSRRA
jgi:serine/threonine-protein kinase